MQLVDFWRENDVFTMLIQRSFSTEKKGDEFWANYEKARKTMEFYQNSGSCDYFFQDPTFELVEIEAYRYDLSIGANTENLVRNIDSWLNSEFIKDFFIFP